MKNRQVGFVVIALIAVLLGSSRASAITDGTPPPRQVYSETQLLSAIQEFGHIFEAIRLGRRFQEVEIVAASSDAKKQSTIQFVEAPVPTVQSLVAELFTQLGPRAMEKVLFSANPLELSANLAITSRSSADIREATQSLYNLLFEYGLDPFAGVIDRRGTSARGRYANFAELPAEHVEALSLILRDIENFVVRDFLSAFPKEWYIDKITRLAGGGKFTEAQIYELLGLPHPGPNAIPVGEMSPLEYVFQESLAETPPSVLEARRTKLGQTQTTPPENLQGAIRLFIASLQLRMHGETIPHPELPPRRKIGFDTSDPANIAPPRTDLELCERAFAFLF